MLTALAVSIILFLIQYKRRQVIFELEKGALRQTFDNQLLQSRLEVQEQSFKFFSEEIHDNVGQLLSVVGMHLYQLKPLCNDPQVEVLVSQSSEILQKAITDLRAVSHTLNAQYIAKAGLVASLQKELTHISTARALDARLHVEGETLHLTPERELLLFRILQESLANVLKHAGATRVDVRLHYAPGTLSASVSDDGRGFDPAAVDGAASGIGLSNMYARALLLGGTLAVRSERGGGTELSLTIGTDV